MRELHSNPESAESESGSSADDVLFAQFVNFGDADISDNDG
jgi:hypothetical protein